MWCGTHSPTGECDPRDTIDRLRAMLRDAHDVIKAAMACPDDGDTLNALYDVRSALDAYFANDPRKH